MSVLARSRMARTVLVAAAALSLAAGTAASAASAAAAPAPAAHGVGAAAHDYRRACALTHRPGIAACMVLVRTDVKQHSAAYFHSNAPVGFGYGRPALKLAYNLPSSSPVRNVAVVDAYNDPSAVSDLAVYRSSWGLPACNTTTEAGCLTVTNENGAASPLPANSGTTGWATEESLDVDMVSAICPKCHIFLVEANSPSISDLGTGVNSAVSVLGAGYVSNSYGAGDNSSETSWDTAYYQHAGVAVTASAGDSGYGVEYPAASQYVTAVGGTTLRRNSGTSRGWTETVWGSASGGEGTGSGCSQFEPEAGLADPRGMQPPDQQRCRGRRQPQHRRGHLRHLRPGRLARGRRDQRGLTDHRRGLRAGRHASGGHLPVVLPVRRPQRAERRHRRRRWHLQPTPIPVPRRGRLRRADRTGHAERHRRLHRLSGLARKFVGGRVQAVGSLR